MRRASCWEAPVASWSKIARRIRVPTGFVFSVVYLWLAQPRWATIAAGGAIALLGIAIRAFASGHVKKNAELTTTGPYAHTRNPLYLGSLILGAGFAVAAWNWMVAAIMAAIFVAIYIPVIRGEEAFLRQTFAEYDEYARRVPRLLPRLTAAGEHGAFSHQLYWKHREYNALLGTAAVLGALVIKLVWFRH